MPERIIGTFAAAGTLSRDSWGGAAVSPSAGTVAASCVVGDLRLSHPLAPDPVGLGVQGGTAQSVFALEDGAGVPGGGGLRGDPGVPVGPVTAAERLFQRLPVGNLVDPRRGDVRFFRQGHPGVRVRVLLEVDEYLAALGDGDRDRTGYRQGGEVAEQQVSGGGGVRGGERDVAVAHRREFVARFAVHRPPGRRAVGLVDDELHVELAGRRIGPDDRGAALVEFRTAVGARELGAEEGTGASPSGSRSGLSGSYRNRIRRKCSVTCSLSTTVIRCSFAPSVRSRAP